MQCMVQLIFVCQDKREKEQPTTRPAVLVTRGCARRSATESLRSRTWDITSSVMMTLIIMKHCDPQPKEGAVFIVLCCQMFITVFLNWSTQHAGWHGTIAVGCSVWRTLYQLPRLAGGETETRISSLWPGWVWTHQTDCKQLGEM